MTAVADRGVDEPTVARGWPRGLDESEAASRAARGQGNAAGDRGSVPLARILRRNVFTILNGALFSVSLALLALGLVADALVTAGPVATNVIVSVALEIDAKRKLDRLTLITRPAVTLRRAGRSRRARPEEVVLGDVVVLERGDQAVVDGTVLGGELEVDESVLTGESEPVVRHAGDPVRSGSICTAGSGALEVTAVGDATFANRLAREARRGSDERTPLRRDLDTLILAIGIVTVVAAVPVLFALRATGQSLLSTESVQAAAVLVALVPQGLAVMATVTYALAAVRISRAGAIVQRIDAVESMSRVDTLCLDKTGTLTTQGLVLDTIVPLAEDAESLLRAMAASASGRNRTLDAVATALPGDPVALASEVPFSSGRRWSGVVLDGRPPRGLMLGAPEAFVHGPMSSRTPPGGELDRQVAQLAAGGRRVLLFAEAIDGQLLDARSTANPPAATPLAILGFREELRPDAADTLGRLRAADIDLKIISGDNPVTVAALAHQVGIDSPRVLSGPEVEAADDAELGRAAAEAGVFGRIQPDDKRRLVTALRDAGRYVGMTGDGVNDVLALRRANLGIAMESGSPAARAVAGLVLLRDRFAVLPRSIVEGQRVVSGMMAVASLLLSRTVYMLLICVAAALLGTPFPFTPRNNAVLALVTVGIPTMVIALWVPALRSPRSVVRTVLRFAVPSGFAVAALALPVLIVAFEGADPALGRSTLTMLTVFSGIALIPILFPAVADRSGPVGPGGDVRPALLALAMLALYALIGAVPPGRAFFDLEVLPVETIAALFGYTVAWMLAILAFLRLRAGLPLLPLPARRRPDQA